MEEERMAKIEGTVSQMNERLNHLGDEIMQLRSEMKEEIRELRSETKLNFRWTLAIILASWITMIGTFVGFFIALLDKLPK